MFLFQFIIFYSILFFRSGLGKKGGFVTGPSSFGWGPRARPRPRQGLNNQLRKCIGSKPLGESSISFPWKNGGDLELKPCILPSNMCLPCYRSSP